MSTKEMPSIVDIVPQSSITYDDTGWHIDTKHLNIPFTKLPHLGPIFEIPDTNSMDGLMDYGNNPLYFHPADEENHRIMVDWIAKTWLDSKGLQTVDAVYRIMKWRYDDVDDWDKEHLIYAIHRLLRVSTDKEGRYFTFGGINNRGLFGRIIADPYRVRDKNIMFLNAGVIY